jgi:hypothetical protein
MCDGLLARRSNIGSRMATRVDLKIRDEVGFAGGYGRDIVRKLKLFTTCTVCAGLHEIPYAPVVVYGPSQLCHTGNLQVRARPITT